MNKSEIIEQLENWKSDIEHDINKAKDWDLSELRQFEQFEQEEQWRKLDQEIMILKEIGQNNNITE